VAKKASDRRSSIAELIARDGRVSVERLAADFSVSVETIRRDLTVLSEQGLVRKVHGGASPPRLLVEGSFSERMVEDPDAKQAIAFKLNALVRPGDTLFMDTGSTTLIAAGALLATGGLTIVTNSLRIAQAMGRSGAGGRAHLLGGLFVAGNDQTVGQAAIDQIAQFQADHAVITVAGLDADVGATDADEGEAQIARAMIRRANNVVVLATSSKFGRRAAFRVCGLEGIGAVLSDTQPSGPLQNALLRQDISVP